MKAAKIRKSKEKKVEMVNEGYSIKSMVKIIISILAIFGIFYGITVLIVEDKEVPELKQESVLDSSKITVGQLLSRKEKEYYVLAHKESLYETSGYVESSYLDIYELYIREYINKEDSLEFYYIDLDNALNKKFYSEKLNITEELEELSLNDEVLFKIKNGKIEKTYVGKDKIISKLSKI